jgi:hypothetical protein
MGSFAAWISHNRRQIALMALSVACGVALYFWPAGKPLVGAIVGAFTLAGLQFQPIAIPRAEEAPATTPSAAPRVPPLPVFFVLALLVVVGSSCAAGAANAAYDRDLAACELSPTCETWVACRKSAATKNGRTFEAHCTTLDAGTP